MVKREPAIVFHIPSTMTIARTRYMTLSITVVAENTGPTVRRRWIRITMPTTARTPASRQPTTAT
jgi:hypothetical protein